MQNAPHLFQATRVLNRFDTKIKSKIKIKKKNNL